MPLKKPKFKNYKDCLAVNQQENKTNYQEKNGTNIIVLKNIKSS